MQSFYGAFRLSRIENLGNKCPPHLGRPQIGYFFHIPYRALIERQVNPMITMNYPRTPKLNFQASWRHLEGISVLDYIPHECIHSSSIHPCEFGWFGQRKFLIAREIMNLKSRHSLWEFFSFVIANNLLKRFILAETSDDMIDNLINKVIVNV